MKRVLMVMCLLVSPGVLLAQNKLVFKGGFNVASMSNALSAELEEPISKPGFHVGLGAEYPLLENRLAIQPVLQFVQRGYVANFKTQSGRSTTTLNYIDLPVNVLWKIGNQEKSTRFLLFGGGYLACGLSGKTRDRVGGQLQNEYSVRFNYDLQRFDYGVQGGIGIQFDFFQLTAFYQQGLANVSGLGLDVKNRTYGLTLGYLFDNVF
jgi:hypothetical protein